MSEALFQRASGRAAQFTTFDPSTGGKTRFIAPGGRQTVFDVLGTGIVTRIWSTLPGWFYRYWDPKAAVDPSVLRLTILKIYFDGCDEPSIAAPIGDFFGIGHMEYRHYASKWLGMSSGGLYSFFPMPFERGFRLEVENLHETETVEIFFNVSCRMLDVLPEGSLRFHCAFQCGENPGALPLEVADIRGTGHFAGCALSIQGKEPNTLSYLEAPEYVWLDGEETPSIMGTGLEDYFGGGWYFREGEFAAPLHGAPLKDALRSMVSMYRFMDADRIPFERGFRMAFVNPWKADRLGPFIHSSTAYYYLAEARAACYTLPEREKLTRLYRVRNVDHQSVP